MSRDCKLSEVKPGQTFMLLLGRNEVGLPFELVKFNGEFAECVHRNPVLDGDPAQLSVPGAWVRLIEEPNDCPRNP